MRKFLALSTAAALIGCASQSEAIHSPSGDWSDQAIVTYYDRNHDGIVDYEFHDFGCCDRNWGLVDTDFNGRYDLRLQWGYSFEQNPVDAPVAIGVTISTDEPDIPPL